MEDLLCDISDQTIKERNFKLKQLIEVEQNRTLLEIQNYRSELHNLLQASLEVNRLDSLPKTQRQRQMDDKHRRSDNLISIAENNKESKIDAGKFHRKIQQFVCAYTNIVRTYYTLLTDVKWLSLRTQRQNQFKNSEIQQKISSINALIQKSSMSFIKEFSSQIFTSEQSSHEIVSQIHSADSKVESQAEEVDYSEGVKTLKKRKIVRKPQKEKSKNSKIPHQSIVHMQRWLLQHFQNPYPNNQQKQILARKSNLLTHQVNNWFINARERVVKKHLRKDSSSLNQPVEGKDRSSKSRIRKNSSHSLSISSVKKEQLFDSLS